METRYFLSKVAQLFNLHISARVTLFFVIIFAISSLTAQEELQEGDLIEGENNILVVTNRAMTQINQEQIIFEPTLDEQGKFSFVNAGFKNENWNFTLMPDIKSLFEMETQFEDWMVFVHGDSKTLLSSVERARQIQELHKVNIIVYSWPSKDFELGAMKNFKNSVSNVENSTGYFADFLLMLEELKNSSDNPLKDHNISIFFHSLGNYYLERLVADGYHLQFQNTIFDNLILNAAAVEQEGHKLWVEEVLISKRIYINSNDDDFSLSGLRILTKLGRQLGESALPPYATNATYVDFTEAVGFPGSMGPSHSYYFATITEKSENIKSYYTNLFHGREASLNDPDLFASASESSLWSIRF